MLVEQFRFWFEAITSMASVLALGAIALELQRARKADTRDFLYRTLEKATDIQKERGLVDSLEVVNLDELLRVNLDPKVALAWTKVFNFWSTLAETVMEGAIDKRIAIQTWGQPFYGYYRKFGKVFREADAIGDPEFYKEMHLFAQEIENAIPDRIKSGQKWNTFYENWLSTETAESRN